MSTSIATIVRPGLTTTQLQQRAPAVFAAHQFDHLGDKYTFISTQQLVETLADAGFQPTAVRQRHSRGDRHGYARHMIRFRQADATVVVDCMPEIILINSHDGTSSYQLRGGLYRFVCENGLIVSLADFGLIRVPHRGNVLTKVVDGALEISRHLDGIGGVINRMAMTELDPYVQLALAEQALALRYRRGSVPFGPEKLLIARRDADRGNDLWSVYNKIQENVICGGIDFRSGTGRRLSSRRITAVAEDLRINMELWQRAMQLIRV